MSGTKVFSAVVLLVGLITSGGCALDAGPSISGAVPATSVGGVPAGEANDALDAVMAGNAQAISSAPSLVPAGAPLAPFIEARLYAISTIAIHDALNAIVPRFERYADTGPIERNAGIAAAVLTAAHDAIVGADPGAQPATDAWYATAISSHQGTTGFDEGVALGHRVAAAILANRANDGTAGGGVAPYTPGTSPGDYQFTFPFNTPGFDFFGTGGFADASMWAASVAPFGVLSTSQFRAPRPYGALTNSMAVQTQQYTNDFNEVKALGCAGCTERTAEQTEIALFWVENSPTGWNRIAGVIAQQRRLDAWDTARLLAMVQIGQFDSYACNFDSKYFYNFWRPVSAVALADNDGNPGTSSAAGWEVLAFPTPPVPDYPSAHSSAGGAAAAIIEALLPGRGRSFTITSGSLPGVSRTFATVDDAARENGMSRVYVGFHFRTAVNAGIELGREVGSYVARNSLKPLAKQ
ncbi:MAG TPA: vanadium-dependent haloperoxidase [Gemmatimonadaceae bacterium]